MPSELPAEGMVLLTFWMGVSLLAYSQLFQMTHKWFLAPTFEGSQTPATLVGSDAPFWLTKAPANYGIYAYIQAYAHSHKRISKTFFKKNVCTYIVCTYKCLVQDEKQ